MRKPILVCTSVLVVIATLACGTSTPVATPVATPDTQGTVDAAVAATGTAQAGMQATIAAAVQATQAAVPSPTPAPEYVAMPEEELAAEVDGAVDEAATAADDCSAAAAEAAADGTITAEEAAELEAYAAEAELAIAYAEDLIDAYYALYGDLATETLALLVQVEQDLAVMSDEVADLNAVLVEIDQALEEGLTLAEETIEQLETAAQAAGDKAAEIRAQNEAWITGLQAEMENRAAAVLAVEPDQIAGDRQEAVQMAFQYVDGVRDGLADGKITKPEMATIAQLGANASAGLQAHGGPQLQQLPGSINTITEQLARGQVPQAKAGLGGLESALGTRPSPPKPPRP
jgi:ElaB/YqjD/DUF883 family membrane-anchored ribosome-binding protein